jgi:hypothetical protein
VLSNYSALPTFLTGRGYTFYAQADDYNGDRSTKGVITECDEDNIGRPYTITMEAL